MGLRAPLDMAKDETLQVSTQYDSMMCFDPTHLDLDTIQIQNLVIGSSSDTIQIRSNAQVTSFTTVMMSMLHVKWLSILAIPPQTKKLLVDTPYKPM